MILFFWSLMCDCNLLISDHIPSDRITYSITCSIPVIFLWCAVMGLLTPLIVDMLMAFLL